MDQENQTIQPVPEISSFITRAANVFSAPGELYAEVSQSPVRTSSWLAPYICSIILSVLVFIALAGNQTLRQQLLEPGRQELQKQVDEGKMTQDQREQASAIMEGKIFLVIGTAGAAFFVTAFFFAAPLVLWGIMKFGFKLPRNYKKLLEMYGLASLIGILGTIVTLLLMYQFESIHARPGGSLLVLASYDIHNVGHNLLGSLNVFTLWEVAVTGIGLAKLSGKSTGVAMATVFGIWLVWTIIASFLGWV